MESAFGVGHGEISKAEQKDKKNTAAIAAGGTAAGAGVLMGTKMPEHSHYSHKTRKELKKLPAGVHEIDTKKLAKKPRKLGARKQQTPYVAAMAQERPTPYSPVPITRYKDGVVQRDNAHSVMANSMKGRKTLVKIEDAPGYRPRRRTGEELTRRAQAYYQQGRLKRNTGLSEKKIEAQRKKYKDSSRVANTTKRPHGVVEEGFKVADKPYKLRHVGQAVSSAKKVVAKRDPFGIEKSQKERRDVAAGATGAAGAGVLATTPVRRSGAVVDIKDGNIKANDAKKILAPGTRPGNKKAIRTMGRNLGHLENSKTTVIRYKDGTVIPWDGNHRGTARVARGDSSIPVKTIEGKERPAVSVARNAYHVGQQKVHRSRMNRDVFKPTGKEGKHAAESRTYRAFANASPSRSGRKGEITTVRAAAGPTKTALRTRQGATIAAGSALIGTAGAMRRKKDR